MMGQAFFMALTVGIVIVGIRKGIELYVTVLMPAVVLLMLVLLGRTLFLEGALEGVAWFFRPDFGGMTFDTILEAVGL